MRKNKKAEEEKERLDQVRQEELRKKLDEPEPKKLSNKEKEEYLKKYNEIIDLFTEINLRQMNQKNESNVE